MLDVKQLLLFSNKSDFGMHWIWNIHQIIPKLNIMSLRAERCMSFLKSGSLNERENVTSIYEITGIWKSPINECKS